MTASSMSRAKCPLACCRWENKHESQAISFEICNNFAFFCKSVQQWRDQVTFMKMKRMIVSVAVGHYPPPTRLSEITYAGMRQSGCWSVLSSFPNRTAMTAGLFRKPWMRKEERISHLFLWIAVFSETILSPLWSRQKLVAGPFLASSTLRGSFYINMIL